uniref:Uncharacterized protein n=1 Tax=Strigamia maritima TaxID=126957 RepID=T1J1C5_STRMM
MFQMNDPRRTISDPTAQQLGRATAGANPIPPTNPATGPRVQNPGRCCLQKQIETPILEETGIPCAGPVAFRNPLAGSCDVDLKFRADVDLVEKFIPRNTPAYPPMSDPPCAEGSEDSSEFLVDKSSGAMLPVQYSPCFESWKRGGYQRER